MTLDVLHVNLTKLPKRRKITAGRTFWDSALLHGSPVHAKLA